MHFATPSSRLPAPSSGLATTPRFGYTMPPRKKKLTAGPVDVDLTGSSPEPAPKPKRAQKAVVDLVQDEEDADLAMGRALQEEENAGAREKGMQDEVVVMEVSWLAGPAGARSVGTGASTVGSAKSRCFPGSEAWLERTAVARGRAGCLVCRHSCGARARAPPQPICLGSNR